MPVDKFGRMSDTKTKDTGVSLTYINNNYVRSDGGTPLTGSLDMRGNTIYNVADPVNPQDVVTKEYVDNVKSSRVIRNKNTHIITASANYYGGLIKDTFQFSFGGVSLQQHKTEIFNGFLMPYSGYIKDFVLEDFGLKIYYSGDIISYIEKKYGFITPVPYFTLVLLKTNGEIEELGVLYIRFVITSYEGPKINYGYFSYKPIPGKESYKINKYDILNIRSELTTAKDENLNVFNFDRVVSDGNIPDKRSINFKLKYSSYEHFTYLATVLIELDLL